MRQKKLNNVSKIKEYYNSKYDETLLKEFTILYLEKFLENIREKSTIDNEIRSVIRLLRYLNILRTDYKFFGDEYTLRALSNIHQVKVTVYQYDKLSAYPMAISEILPIML
jgi:hypothetical protein